jgi:hypothetical protein
LTRFRSFVRFFFKHCEGRLSVRHIADSGIQRLGSDRKETYRFAAFLTYILGQTGLIRSGRDAGSAGVRERPLPPMERIPVMLQSEGEGATAGMGARLQEVTRGLWRSFVG